METPVLECRCIVCLDKLPPKGTKPLTAEQKGLLK